MPLVEGDLSNRFCSRALAIWVGRIKLSKTLIAQARLAAVRCVCVAVHT